MASPKLNYYEILGLNQSATFDEIRRAYRILARRYHPDLNPGKSSEERFKIISLAYQTLSDSVKKQAYDSEVDSAKRIRAGFAAYERAQGFASKSKKSNYGRESAAQTQSSKVRNNQSKHTQKNNNKNTNDFRSSTSSLLSGMSKIKSFFYKKKSPQFKHSPEVSTSKISVIEVSITMQEALFGGRKAVEVAADPNNKKISLRIPAGVRTGSVLRMRMGNQQTEDYIIILRVAPDPLISLLPKGVIVEIPVTISEALFGASLKVPGLEEEENIIIPPASQSGQEIRVINRGIRFDDGHRGDIFYRLNINIPLSHQAVGLKEKISAVSEYYETPLRQGLPMKLKGIVG